MDNSPEKKFENYFNDIVNKLRAITNSDENVAFPALVEKATSLKNPIIDRYSSELKELNKLRNLIVHSKSNKRQSIALPTEYAVNEISKISDLLMNPPKVIPLFQKNVLFLQYNDPVKNAVKIIYNKKYSQIPIYNKEVYIGLLTTNTIAMWLGTEDIFDLSETLISHVFNKFTEDKDSYLFISRDASLFEVLEKFYTFQNRGKRLEAILITNSAKKEESLLGIITIYDLPKIYQALK